jgi:hypothetical protein
VDDAPISTLRSIIASAALLTLPAVAQDHRFEADPVVTVRENIVACDVLSQLQRVMENSRFLLAGEMRAAEPRTSGPYLHKPRAICLYLSGRYDHTANGHTRKYCRNNPSNAPAVTREGRRIGPDESSQARDHRP